MSCQEPVDPLVEQLENRKPTRPGGLPRTVAAPVVDDMIDPKGQKLVYLGLDL